MKSRCDKNEVTYVSGDLDDRDASLRDFHEPNRDGYSSKLESSGDGFSDFVESGGGKGDDAS
jgi:hypothetical protein